MATYGLNCINSSNSVFNLALSGVDHNGHNSAHGVHVMWGTEPLSVLEAAGGASTATVTSKLSDFEVGPDVYWNIYYDPVSGWVFGFKIVVPQEVYHMGYSPYYEYCAFTSTTAPSEIKAIVWTRCSGSATVGPTPYGIFTLLVSGTLDGQNLTTTLTINSVVIPT